MSCISHRLAKKLRLEPRDFIFVNTASGFERRPIYSIHLLLPGNFEWLNHKVVEFTFTGDNDFIIGMDIISQGDFSITNFDGRTVLSFRTPSLHMIDYQQPPTFPLFDQIQNALQFIRTRTAFEPRTGIILGTGLSGLADEIEAVETIDYHQIPHFPISTVESHRGKLIFGYLAGEPVVAMAGRFHFYEGYTLQQVTFPVRVMKFLGIERLIVSNASGGTNPSLENGDLVFIKDHINMLGDNPLRGANDERLGVRFPDMLHVYDPEMLAQAMQIAHANGIRAHLGVYVGLAGPNLETPAEYAFIHRMGGDIVGMSTVPEVIVARHSNLKVFAVSVVTDKGYPPEEIRETTLEDVIAVAKAAEPKVKLVVNELLRLIK